MCAHIKWSILINACLVSGLWSFVQRNYRFCSWHGRFSRFQIVMAINFALSSRIECNCYWFIIWWCNCIVFILLMKLEISTVCRSIRHYIELESLISACSIHIFIVDLASPQVPCCRVSSSCSHTFSISLVLIIQLIHIVNVSLDEILTWSLGWWKLSIRLWLLSRYLLILIFTNFFQIRVL